MWRAVILMSICAACTANDDIPAPQAGSVSPDHAPPGEIVEVTGAYFCQRPDNGDADPTCNMEGTVYFGDTPGTPTSWDDSAVMVEVPNGMMGEVSLSVAIAGRTSNSISFTID